MSSDIIDKAVWDQLREFEKNEEVPYFFKNLLHTVLTTAPPMMELLLSSVENEEVKKVQYYSHTLKSTASSLGAMGLGKLLGEIESGCVQTPVTIRKDLIPEVSKIFGLFIQEVQDEFDHRR